LAGRDGYLKVVGTGGTLRENSTSHGALERSPAAAEEAGTKIEPFDFSEPRLPMYEPGTPLEDYGLISTAGGERVGAVA
jgi:NAD(P)H-dependent FMN reductase